jgi:FkbM family methyltransferase
MKEIVYKVINLLTGGKGLTKKIHGIPVRLPTRYINYFPADYEKENFDFLKSHLGKGDIVLDIGAHIGLFSVIAARITGNEGKIYAFEPSGDTYGLLEKTVAINSLAGIIEPVKGAVGMDSGFITFYESKVVGDNSNSLVSYKTDRELQAVQVKLYSIDGFVKQHNITSLKFIKIDVEGAEYDAIRGAKETLRSLKPVCTLGIHPDAIAAKGDNLGQIYDFIMMNNYKILEGTSPVSRAAFCNTTDLIDFHLLPAE